ncbi:MAG: hypothetical protein N0C81_13065 [Candidatus Thiodiazotropha lotti]|nr:hypothetical protein [Candidatus Thiodiazotropha lotti]MCG8005441.1 hypothetical protein [Candidatus Thiodiazotropha lotti]MCG8008562.1 hypothetical protein [Candidatus Thiodiazotropha lotti]MCW4189068.1 hypothetical protein [Candidatus Thiodiazotropha lotti]MCW4196151.1 hypothetical protein [Candidatus Thiodiazotropha lotti]
MEKGDVSKVSFAIIDGCPDLFLAKPPGKIGGGHNFIPTEIMEFRGCVDPFKWCLSWCLVIVPGLPRFTDILLQFTGNICILQSGSIWCEDLQDLSPSFKT